MSAANHDHPDRAELEGFGIGVLSPARSAAVEKHVAGCESCCEAVHQAPDDTLVNRLHEAATLPPLAAGPETVGLPLAVSDAPVEAPADLERHPRYRLIRLLGRGGMGAVYQAEHGVMRRLVALKVINREYTANPAAVQRFQREIRAAAQLHHPNIVAAYDAEQAGDTHFLVMEYIDGVNLARLVAEKGPLPVAEACDYVRQAALGLQYAHERGMVHRDVKPHNLIRAADGMVKVLDFGLASVGEPGEGQLTGTNVVMGTPDYIAPEQAEDAHTADARSDIYSLGCTLYFLLTGRPPFARSSPLRTLLAHRQDEPPPLSVARPDAPPALAAVLARMTAKAPADRYQTAAEVAAALAPFIEPTAGCSLRERPATRGASRPLWRRRRLGAAAAALLAVLIAAALLFVRLPARPGEATVAPIEPKELEVVRRFPWTGRDAWPAVAFSADGRLCVGYCREAIRVWEVETGRPVGAAIDFDSRVATAEFLPDGTQLLSAHEDGTLRRWDLATGKPLGKLQRQVGWPLIGGVSPDGDRVAWHDGTVHVDEVESGKERIRVKPVGAKASLIASHRMSPDGRKMLTADNLVDQGISILRISDAKSGELLRSITYDGLSDNVAWGDDSNRAYVNAWDNELKAVVLACYDADTGKSLSNVRLEPQPTASWGRYFSPDGRWFAVEYMDRALLHLYDAVGGKLAATAHRPNTSFGFAFSPKGTYAVCGAEKEVILYRLPARPADGDKP